MHNSWVATLYVLCGLPFSGKSHWAQAHAAAHGSVVISLDQINANRGLAFGGHGRISIEQWEETHQIALKMARNELGQGRSVIIDDTGCYAFLRKRYIEVSAELGHKAIIVWFDVRESELQQRRAFNSQTNRRPEVATEVFDHLVKTFENPTDDEAPILIVSS